MRAFLLCLVIPLSGCVGAALLATSVAPILFAGYSVYEFENIENARYDVNRVAPDPDALAEIRAAQTIAYFPSNRVGDGVAVDGLRERSTYTVISSRETLAYVEARQIWHSRVLSYPEADRADEMRLFGQAMGVDLVIFADLSPPQSNPNVFLPGRSTLSYRVAFRIYSGPTGTLLLDERHVATFDVSDQHGPEDLARLFAYGAADRLQELTTGETRFAGTTE